MWVPFVNLHLLEILLTIFYFGYLENYQQKGLVQV